MKKLDVCYMFFLSLLLSSSLAQVSKPIDITSTKIIKVDSLVVTFLFDDV